MIETHGKKVPTSFLSLHRSAFKCFQHHQHVMELHFCWWSISSWSNNHAVQSNRRNGLLEALRATLSSDIKLDIEIGSQEHVAKISRSTVSSYIYLFLDVTYLRKKSISFLHPDIILQVISLSQKINSTVGWNSSEQLMPSLVICLPGNDFLKEVWNDIYLQFVCSNIWHELAGRATMIVQALAPDWNTERSKSRKGGQCIHGLNPICRKISRVQFVTPELHFGSSGTGKKQNFTSKIMSCS